MNFLLASSLNKNVCQGFEIYEIYSGTSSSVHFRLSKKRRIATGEVRHHKVMTIVLRTTSLDFEGSTK